MDIKLVCNGKNGCGKFFGAEAFYKGDIQKYVNPETPNVILCQTCRIKNQPRKRKRPCQEDINKMIKATVSSNIHPSLMGSVDIEEVTSYFQTRPKSYFEELDTPELLMCKSPVGLAQLYTSDEEGGGADVHPTVRLFWRLALKWSNFFCIVSPGVLNKFNCVHRHYTGLFGREETCPKDIDEFIKQSLDIKHHGTPILTKRGEEHFICNV
jgi:hypothetical protein